MCAHCTDTDTNMDRGQCEYTIIFITAQSHRLTLIMNGNAYFGKKNWRTLALFVVPLIPRFWTSSNVCPWIQSDNMAPPPPQTHTVHHALVSWVLISIVAVNYYKDRKINIRYIWKTWIQTKVQKQLINYQNETFMKYDSLIHRFLF